MNPTLWGIFQKLFQSTLCVRVNLTLTPTLWGRVNLTQKATLWGTINLTLNPTLWGTSKKRNSRLFS